MSTIEMATEPSAARSTRPAIQVGDDLRSATAPTKLSFRWLGVTRSLSGDQKQRAAGAFGAEQEYLRAGKKILDTNHPAYKAVTAIRSQARSLRDDARQKLGDLFNPSDYPDTLTDLFAIEIERTIDG